MKPTPEQLAAYADGQLHRRTAQVEGWLVEHPDAAAEVESYRRLARLWDTTSAPEPPPACLGSHAGPDQGSVAGQAALPVPFRPGRGGLAGLAVVRRRPRRPAAAAALFGPRAPGYPGEVRSFPVASAQDVTIISMDAGDVELLVVARPR